MIVYITCCLMFALFSGNIIDRCNCQSTNQLDTGNSNDGSCPSKILISMVDQLREQFAESTKTLRAEYRQLTESLQAENQRLTESLKAENQRLTDEVKNLTAQISNVEGNNHQPVKSAFSAFMTVGHFVQNNSADIVLPINGVSKNLNGDYNSTSSTYTCPISGVYYFSYAVYLVYLSDSLPRYHMGFFHMYVSLAVGDELKNEASCRIDRSIYVNINCWATKSITIHCNRGDPVQVKISSRRMNNLIYETSKNKRTTFNGHLLFADDLE